MLIVTILNPDDNSEIKIMCTSIEFNPSFGTCYLINSREGVSRIAQMSQLITAEEKNI